MEWKHHIKCTYLITANNEARVYRNKRTINTSKPTSPKATFIVDPIVDTLPFDFRSKSITIIVRPRRMQK